LAIFKFVAHNNLPDYGWLRRYLTNNSSASLPPGVKGIGLRVACIRCNTTPLCSVVYVPGE